MLRKGYESGLSKQQVANIFQNQKLLAEAHLSPFEAIDQYTGDRNGTMKTEFYNDCTSIPDPSELDASEKNLLILDDCYLGKQTKAMAYYSRGRHNSCDVLYIAQNYFSLPRHSIRENANLMILFPQDSKNLYHIYSDHCGDDMTFEEFKSFCRTVWKTRHNFITIDLTSEKLSGRYRQNLDRFYLPGIKEVHS